MSNGWNESANAWIKSLGESGDYGRQFVLDAPMMERVRAGAFTNALDVGCGEGRFCRMMQPIGIAATGVDPAEALITRAREQDPVGVYMIGQAEALDFADQSFDLVVSYLSLIDIADFKTAIGEMVRVLRPGGTLLIANLNGFISAGQPDGWVRGWRGPKHFAFDHYLEERADWVSWRGITIQNWHRPLSSYMGQLLSHGLRLTHFSEPEPVGGDPDRAKRYRRAPYFLIMEWQKL